MVFVAGLTIAIVGCERLNGKSSAATSRRFHRVLRRAVPGAILKAWLTGVGAGALAHHARRRMGVSDG
jgi:hypothetical protein